LIAFSLLAFLFGLIIGSFLNVCIYRLPRDLSVVKPRSFCPGCQKQIAWYDNIPVLSFFLLGRKCRYCGTPISFRYALVELLTGLLFFLIVLALGPTVVAFKLCVLCALLVGLTFTDLDALILPDELTLGGTVVGFLFAWFVPVDDRAAHVALTIAGFHPSQQWAQVAESVVGAVLPASFLGLGGWLFEKIRHKEGLGLGDVKMIAMVGAFLGLSAALLTLIIGSIAGSVIGLIYIYATKKDASTYELPFGSFLGFAGIVVALTGAPVIHWYLGLL
jgi:leader peptidase (prepilin peptidase)/N-methyltransferase